LFSWVVHVQGVRVLRVGGFDEHADLLETLADHRVHSRFLGVDLARWCVPSSDGVAVVALGEQDLAVADEEQVDVHEGSLWLSHARGQYRSRPAGFARLVVPDWLRLEVSRFNLAQRLFHLGCNKCCLAL